MRLVCDARLWCVSRYEELLRQQYEERRISSRRSLSTQEILKGPEQALKILFRDSNMNADDIM